LEQQIVDLPAGLYRQDRARCLMSVDVDLVESGLFEHDAVTTGLNSFNAKATFRIGLSGVVATLFLVIGDYRTPPKD